MILVITKAQARAQMNDMYLQMIIYACVAILALVMGCQMVCDSLESCAGLKGGRGAIFKNGSHIVDAPTAGLKV